MSTENAKTSVAPKKRAPTLYFIVAIKLIKGTLLLLLALSIFSLANKDLPELFNQFLGWVHLDPERNFFAGISRLAGHRHARQHARVCVRDTVLYGLFLLVGGTGLAFRAKWAIWLAIGESAFFIPIEIFELIRRRLPKARGPAAPGIFSPSQNRPSASCWR